MIYTFSFFHVMDCCLRSILYYGIINLYNTANMVNMLVSEKWHHFWELPCANLLGLVEVAEENTIFPILSKYRY